MNIPPLVNPRVVHRAMRALIDASDGEDRIDAQAAAQLLYEFACRRGEPVDGLMRLRYENCPPINRGVVSDAYYYLLRIIAADQASLWNDEGPPTHDQWCRQLLVNEGIRLQLMLQHELHKSPFRPLHAEMMVRARLTMPSGSEEEFGAGVSISDSIADHVPGGMPYLRASSVFSRVPGGMLRIQVRSIMAELSGLICKHVDDRAGSR